MNSARVWAVAYKEWLEILRDRIYLSLAFLLPALLMLVFGYGMIQDIDNVALAIADEDRSALSRDYARHFTTARQFSFQGYLRSARDADALLADGRVKVVIVIPHDFSAQLLRGRATRTQSIIDGTFPTQARTIRSYVDAIGAAANAEFQAGYLARRLGVSHEAAVVLLRPVSIEVRYLYNQEVRSIWAIAPSLIMFILMLVTPMLTALSVVREKETGAIYNVYASTITRAELLVGKLLPSISISVVNACVLWVMATRWFDAPFKGSLVFFGVATFAYILCVSTIWLVISLLVRTQIAAMMITTILGAILSMQFSGIISPISSMTGATYAIAQIAPTRYFRDAMAGVFMKGIGFAELWPSIVIFLGYAVVLFVIAWLLFRKRTRS